MKASESVSDAVCQSLRQSDDRSANAGTARSPGGAPGIQPGSPGLPRGDRDARAGEGQAPSAAEATGTTVATRGPRGRFAAGNAFAWRHGLSAFNRSGELPSRALWDDRERFRGAVMADLGGEAALSELERGQVEQLANFRAVLQMAMDDINQRGICTKRGRLRPTFAVYTRALERFERLARRVGTKRKEQKAPDLDSYLRERGGKGDTR
jgi:hypothetical protein